MEHNEQNKEDYGYSGGGSNLDLLKRFESLSNQLNQMASMYTKSAVRRYPLTFTLLILFGVVAVSEGAKGILESMGVFSDHPWYLFITGLVVLIFTGNLYKKLNK